MAAGAQIRDWTPRLADRQHEPGRGLHCVDISEAKLAANRPSVGAQCVKITVLLGNLVNLARRALKLTVCKATNGNGQASPDRTSRSTSANRSLGADRSTGASQRTVEQLHVARSAQLDANGLRLLKMHGSRSAAPAQLS